MTAASGGITAPPFTNFQQHQQLSEDEERISLEKLVRLRDAVRSGQHPNFRPKGSTAAPAATAFNQDRASNNKNANLNGAAGPSQKNDTSARPIPVFTGSMPVPAPAVKPEQNAGRAVITVSGKDTPHQNNQNGVRDPRDDRRQQNHHHHHHQQQQQPPPQQWDPNHQHQPWMIPPGQNQMHGNPNPNPEDINAFAQHLSMLPVPPPPFELPPGFPPLLTVPPLPLPGQPITAGQPLSHLMQMTNQNPTQPDPMVVDKPVLDTKKLEQRDRELLGIQQTAAQIPTTAAVGTDLQASLKKAQEYAATLPPKPAGGQKQNPPIASNKQQQQEKGRIGGAEESPTLAAFPDRRDDDRQNYQRQPPPRDHRQYADKRGAEPLRKTAINNNSVKEDRRERERDRSAFERERERERWAGGVDSRGYNFKKRKSSSPNYDDIPSKTPNFAAPQPIRPVDALIRSHDRRDVVDIDEQDDLKKRANPAPAKDTPKISQNVEKKASPAPPIKREAPPPSPVVTIPRGSPTLEPLSPGRARAYGVPPPQERYQMLPGAKQAGYFRYREPYPPPHLMGYARSPYEQEYGYPPPHARDPRPLSPRRMYPGPEPRGYAQEYIYQDPYQDPYYPYHPRRPGSPPPRGPPGPRYRYEDEDRVPRGRSPSPRAPSRMPMTRPRRSSRSVSPGRERPLPRPSAPPAEPAEESRPERGALIRASDAPHYADYPPSYHHQRSMVPYDAYGDPYRPVIVRERVPVYVTRVVYVDSNDPEGRPYRPRSPGYPPPHAPPPGPPAHAYQQPPQQHPPSSAAGASHPPPPPMRRYVDDPDIVMSDRMYRERDYDYGPYERGYPREYAREYPPPPPHHHHPHHPHHPPPPSAMRDPYGREYAMAPPRDEERERAFREREREYPGPPGPAGGHPPPMPMPSNAARDVEDGRMPYARDGRGMPPGSGVRYS